MSIFFYKKRDAGFLAVWSISTFRYQRWWL